MSWGFWRLPCPASFVEKIHHDLVDNKSVVVLSDATMPDGLLFEIQERVERSGLAWKRVQTDSSRAGHARFLAHQFGADLPVVASLADFLALPAAAGSVVTVEVPDDPGVLKGWSGFLSDYAKIPVADDDMWAPRLLLVWPHGHGGCPLGASRLIRHGWRGVMESTDIQLYAALLVHRSRQSQFCRTLIAAVAAKVSGGDPVLCERLCSCQLQEILDPMPILRDYALTRRWNKTTAVGEAAGTLLLLDGTERPHPALLALQGKSSTIEMLVWSAQVGVLMPLIEERRQELVEQLADRLHVPDDLPPWQTIDSVYDLEVGHIWFQLSNQKRHLPKTVKEQLYVLKKVWDSLAHRKPLSSEFLLEESVIRSLCKCVRH